MRSIHFDETFEAKMTKDIPTIPCDYQKCQKLFTPQRPWQRFCCRRCKDQFWRELRREVTKEIEKRKSINTSNGGTI